MPGVAEHAGMKGQGMGTTAGADVPECDLVMKGGITSGIVYPRAIARLAAHYRLRSIGGASAGAIAAAAAAAAEYGRDQGGFSQLYELPDLLAETEDADGRGPTRLFRLFQPQPATRQLYRLLVAGLMPEKPRWGLAASRWLLAAICNFKLAAAGALGVALVVLAALFVGNEWSFSSGAAWLAGFAGLLVGLLVFVLVLAGLILMYAARYIPANGYGLCSGLGDANTLTPWLHATLQSLAGLDPQRPLRFGDLWRSHDPLPSYTAKDAHQRPALRRIDLRLVTTALSHGRPYSFPLQNEAFFFDVDEMGALFPPDVVAALIADSRGRVQGGPLAGRYRLPAMHKLPVIVPVRMSLSFPLLLSAVPLWRVRRDPDLAARGKWLNVAERVWFSDGGICSNFPIHYFDGLVPSRPTFGINLTDDKFVPPNPQDPDDYVHMPTGNGSGKPTQVVDVEPRGRRGIVGFLSSILTTMQIWSDSTQLATAGFADRVVAVRLGAEESGLNLRMGPELIRRVAARGERAGEVLLQHYAQRDPPPRTVTGWRNHRWVRYRIAMRLIGDALEGLRCTEAATAATDAALQPMHADPPSYKFKSARQRVAALAAYRDVLALADRFAEVQEELRHPPFDRGQKDGPRPRPELRVKPAL